MIQELRHLDRDLKLAVDYAYGADMEQLADKHGLSRQRVGQLLNRVAQRIGMHHVKYMRANPQILVGRIAQRQTRLYVPSGGANTPEEFYYELLEERKVRR